MTVPERYRHAFGMYRIVPIDDDSKVLLLSYNREGYVTHSVIMHDAETARDTVRANLLTVNRLASKEYE